MAQNFFFALCFLLVVLVRDTTCSVTLTQRKLIEFQSKLQQMSPAPTPTPASASTPTPTPASASAPAPAPKADDVSHRAPSVSKRSGRVFYPIGYGADPTGQRDSSDAIWHALNDAFKVQSNLQMLPGVHDLGGVVIDLLGGSYKIDKPIRFPASGGANVVVKGGTLRASKKFPGDRHLIEVWAPNSHPLPDDFSPIKAQNVGIFYEDITFQDILFDSSYRGGGIFIIDSARIRINNCFFLHFTSTGILVHQGHEAFISNCFLGQHSTIGGDKGEQYFSGTAIQLSSNDNAITDVAIFSAGIGVLLFGSANIVTGVHCYNKAAGWGGVGILVKAGAHINRIDNCYLDYTSIVMEDPVQVHVTNGLFLGDANVVLRSIKGQISGVTIVNNMFNGVHKNVPIIQVEGKFGWIDQVMIEYNNVNNMKLKSTVGELSVAGNGTKWVADFKSLLVFPNGIKHFHYSFHQKPGEAPAFPVHAVTNLENNVVVVESDKPANGWVSVTVDQYECLQ